MWDYMGDYGLSCGGGVMGITTLLVWAVLILAIVFLWQKINKK